MAQLPLVPQTPDQYQPVAEPCRPGMPYRDDYRERSASYTNGNPATVLTVVTAQVVFNGTDEVGLSFAGYGIYPVTCDTDAETTALAWIAAWDVTLQALGVLRAATTTDGAGELTLTLGPGILDAPTAYSPATADVTPIAITTAGSGPDLGLSPGYGVVRSGRDPMAGKLARRPLTAAECRTIFAGAIQWRGRETAEALVARGFASTVDIAPDSDFRVEVPGSFRDIYVAFRTFGTPSDAVEDGDVFLVFDRTHPDHGRFAADSGGTGEVLRLTLTTTGLDTIGFDFDASDLASTISAGPVTSVDDSTDQAALVAAFNAAVAANAEYAGRYTAVADGVADILITHSPTLAEDFAATGAVTDTSTVGNSVADAIETVAVAAIAERVGLTWEVGSANGTAVPDFDSGI